MDWSVVTAAALGVIALAITSGGAVLVPFAVSWLREKLLASQNQRLTAAAETVAAELERGLVATAQMAVERLRGRLPDTLKALGDPGDDVLLGLIAKGRTKSQAPCP